MQDWEPLFITVKTNYTATMKNKPVKILLILLVSVVIWSCDGKSSGSVSAEENIDKDTSYALGMDVGADLKNWIDNSGVTPNIDEFVKGIKDSLTGGKTRISADEAGELITKAFLALSEGRNAEAKQAENSFLAENAKKPGVKITASGLQYEIVNETAGPKPPVNSTVIVHYEGRLVDGTVFDSSYERGEAARFQLNQVIAGWTEGIQLMNVGSKFIFYIPSALAYGDNGIQGVIPPFSTLIFNVELLDIIN
jgi:FKBP-type peptidyl-prolyl cis-trans isomerase